jgi:hypothetical protein
VTRLRLNTSTVAMLLTSVAFFVPASLAQAQQSSPFAGEGIGETASESLQYPAPTYEQPDAAVSVAPPAEATFGASQGFVRSAASQLQSLMPGNVSLRAGDGDASLLTIGGVDSGGATESGIPEGIDEEQARELTEQVDPEQIQELSGGQAGAPAMDKWIVHYPVAIEGIPVSEKSDVVAFISASGDIQHVRKRNLPTSVNATEASVSADAAMEAAKADAGGWAADAETTAPALEVFTNADLSGALTYRIDITSSNLAEPNARRYWIAATDEPTVVFWESLIRHQHNGQVTGQVWTESGRPDRPTANMPFDKTTVRRVGGGGGAASTNEHGLYGFTSGGGNATVGVALNDGGQECSVIDNVAGGEMSVTANGGTGSPLDLNLGPVGAEQLAQTTGFHYTNEACKLAKDILDPTDLPNLPTRVNVGGQCNAFWNGSSINFFQAGGNCPNMAYSDVVYHEYGHGVDARKGGIANGGYSEGFGDAMAILGTRQSCVGRDFFGPGTCLREASDVISWPLGSDGVHAQGRRYAGFTYQLIEELKNVYSEDGAYAIATQLVMAAAKANPSDIPDAVKLSFIADDDDGDLTNGTPHFAQLAAAADSRNLPRPADPTTGVRRMGFAWAHSATAAAYAPSPTYAFNSSGGSIKATRSGTGQYAMTFAGLGGQGKAGGNVQVTSYGPTADHCKVYWWSSGGKDFTANVRCFNPAGKLVDTRYTILVTWP